MFYPHGCFSILLRCSSVDPGVNSPTKTDPGNTSIRLVEKITRRILLYLLAGYRGLLQETGNASWLYGFGEPALVCGYLVPGCPLFYGPILPPEAF